MYLYRFVFFFQAEDGIRDLVRSRGLGDVYKRQLRLTPNAAALSSDRPSSLPPVPPSADPEAEPCDACLLYTSDAADERSSVDLGGRRIIKKKKKREHSRVRSDSTHSITHEAK